MLDYLNKDDATEACYSKMGSLFEPDTQSQWTKVVNYVKTKMDENDQIGWIGFHLKSDGDSNLYSDKTSEAVQFTTDWSAEEPDEIKQECVYVTKDGTLSNGFCNELKFRSICQILGR